MAIGVSRKNPHGVLAPGEMATIEVEPAALLKHKVRTATGPMQAWGRHEQLRHSIMVNIEFEALDPPTILRRVWCVREVVGGPLVWVENWLMIDSLQFPDVVILDTGFCWEAVAEAQ